MTEQINKTNQSDIRRDPFVRELFEKLPQELGETFSEAQLQGLKLALGSRKWGHHAVDIRRTIGFFHWRYYYVVLVGRNRRELSRQEATFLRSAELTFITCFLIVSILLGLLVLYLTKSALGIDLFPGYSLGIWGWFQQEFLS